MDMDKPLRIGIMGGTFDPIHYGHLVTAEAARSKFFLDKVIFIPAGKPPHKLDSQRADAEQRLMMTLLATIDNPFFHISRTEIDREGYSYTYDTVKEFLDFYGDGTEIYFITGADAVAEMAGWKNAAPLLKICTFIAASRPGFTLDFTQKLPQEFLPKIMTLTVPALAISSTDIRRRVAQNKPIRYLLPEPVEKYIEKQGLYLMYNS
jgi:nicotinate-nucleotide adenylyltransferase